jgi:periplasmic divalent cation tolerance protein
MPRAEAVIVLSTWPAAEDPVPAVVTLVEEKLAACVNVWPVIQSVYPWKGVIEQAQERQLVIKTTSARVDALLARLGQLHPYEVPETLVVPVAGGGADYLSWLAECVGG